MYKLKLFLFSLIILVGQWFLCDSIVFAADVSVTGLRDVNFGTVAPDTLDLNDIQEVCVYRASGNRRRYYITATGNLGGFVISNGTSSIPYRVEWEASRQPSGFVELFHGVKRRRPFRQSGTSTYCNGGNTNARLRISILGQDIESATAGSYSGILTLLFEDS